MSKHFEIGQTVTTSLGRNGRGEVEIVAGPDADGKYVVKDGQGNMTLKAAKSLRALPEPTIGLAALADVFNQHGAAAAGVPGAQEILRNLVGNLEAAGLTGLTAKVAHYSQTSE